MRIWCGRRGLWRMRASRAGSGLLEDFRARIARLMLLFSPRHCALVHLSTIVNTFIVILPLKVLESLQRHLYNIHYTFTVIYPSILYQSSPRPNTPSLYHAVEC
jgi:hypothetical protein